MPFSPVIKDVFKMRERPVKQTFLNDSKDFRSCTCVVGEVVVKVKLWGLNVLSFYASRSRNSNCSSSPPYNQAMIGFLRVIIIFLVFFISFWLLSPHWLAGAPVGTPINQSIFSLTFGATSQCACVISNIPATVRIPRQAGNYIWLWSQDWPRVTFFVCEVLLKRRDLWHFVSRH